MKRWLRRLLFLLPIISAAITGCGESGRPPVVILTRQTLSGIWKTDQYKIQFHPDGVFEIHFQNERREGKWKLTDYTLQRQELLREMPGGATIDVAHISPPETYTIDWALNGRSMTLADAEGNKTDYQLVKSLEDIKREKDEAANKAREEAMSKKP